MTSSVVVKPWAPCFECKGAKGKHFIGATAYRGPWWQPEPMKEWRKCPICGGTGLAELCIHIWIAKMPSYCVKCHVLFEDRYD